MTFGLVGALEAFPRRLAAREVRRLGGDLQHGVTRRTTHVVFGRGLLARESDTHIEGRLAAVTKRPLTVLSENGFLRMLGLMVAPQAATLSRRSIIDQSGIEPGTFALLSLFDAFEHQAVLYSFRDLILARKYAGLLAGGATWGRIARSVRNSGPITSLTALTLHTEDGEAIYARSGSGLTELDGQGLLPLDKIDDAEPDVLFALAEEAEEQGRHIEAAHLYQRCLAADPGDGIAAFNRANCLRAAGQIGEATGAYMQAIKLDPTLVEAWFNLGGLCAGQGKIASARQYLQTAVTRDPSYADAIYNLANLEYQAGDLIAARCWWSAYLELDRTSEWARTAEKGIRYADLHLGKRAAG
ncbi:tetratricopeptide repeat protein [Mesorhizobium sp. ANAO-SY3R2]|uniref:tetratricopeptide repeat protein n=1 Tax=Mesorhizobium sp. ANAO-SY3R2 TaxID=3166644 RepID=UPI003671F546